MRQIYRLAAAIVFGGIMLLVYMLPPGQALEREYGLPFLYSVRGDLPVPDGAVVIGLDNKSVRRLVGWVGRYDTEAPELGACLPQRAKELLKEAININHIPRPVYACLLELLAKRNAKLIVFDINFHRPKPNDIKLADAIGEAGSVLLFERVGIDEEGNPRRSHPHELFVERARGTMAFHVDSERGEIVTGYLTSWSFEVAGRTFWEDLRAMPDKAWAEYTGQELPKAQPKVQPIWLYGPPQTIPTIALRDVLDPSVDALPQDLSNLAVFVGSSDPEDAAIDDHFPVPTSGRGNELIGGVELAATAFLNRLHGTMLNRPSPTIEALIVFSVAFTGVLAVLTLARWRLILTIATISVGYLVVASLAFSMGRLWLPIAVPVFLTTLLVGLAAISVRYLFARALVSRLAPRQVANMLLDGTSAERRAVRTEHATVIFTDLVGSTRMGEQMDEVGYSDTVNLYYDLATDVIEENGGMVVEFMGDGIVSLFSESVTGRDHAARGCTAARALVRRLVEANEGPGDRPALRIRIGINSGLTATGDIGARRRFQYKALGDVVNVAARLEQHGKSVETNDEHIILISGSTFEYAKLAPETTVPVGTIQVRGREAALDVYRLLL